MQTTWTYDAPAGVYKNHALSSAIRDAAIAETKFMQFVSPEPNYGKKKGESVTITRISNIDEPSDGRVLEANRIPEDELVITTTSVTVSEWGRAVPYTSLNEDLSHIDLNSKIQKKLRDQMKLTLDTAAAAAFKANQVKAVATGAAAIQFDTAGAPTAQALSNLNVFHIERIRDYMFGTLHIPPFMADDYIACVSTKAKRGIMDDPAWEPWNRYTTPENKFRSELGRLEGIRFIEVNHANALSGSIGLAGVAGEAVFFGEDPTYLALVTDPELRTEVPKDFGRQKAVAWYAIAEFGNTWGDSANPGENRVVHFTSLD
jgi:N4-gp56 family major capsid protein